MPLFDTKCSDCGQVVEQYLKVAEKPQDCVCGGDMKRILTSRYYINPDIDVVTADITGEEMRVTSRRHLKQLCAENGVSQKYGKGWW